MQEGRGVRRGSDAYPVSTMRRVMMMMGKHGWKTLPVLLSDQRKKQRAVFGSLLEKKQQNDN